MNTRYDYIIKNTKSLKIYKNCPNNCDRYSLNYLPHSIESLVILCIKFKCSLDYLPYKLKYLELYSNIKITSFYNLNITILKRVKFIDNYDFTSYESISEIRFEKYLNKNGYKFYKSYRLSFTLTFLYIIYNIEKSQNNCNIL